MVYVITCRTNGFNRRCGISCISPLALPKEYDCAGKTIKAVMTVSQAGNPGGYDCNRQCYGSGMSGLLREERIIKEGKAEKDCI